jgi:hypothetical protein
VVNDMVLSSGSLIEATLSSERNLSGAVHRRSPFPQDVIAGLAGKSRGVMHMRTLLMTSLPTGWARLCT